MKKFKYTIAIAVALACTACTEEGIVDDIFVAKEMIVKTVYMLSTDATSISFNEKGESKQITISSNTSWSITQKPDWCSLSTTSGNGNGTITVTATENPEFNSRSGIIIIKGNEVKDVTISVSQEAKTHQVPGSSDNTPPEV